MLCCLVCVVEAHGTSVLPVLPSLLPTLLHTSIQQQEPSPATAALGLLGDLCRALGAQLAPHSDPLLQGLLNRLASTGPQAALLALNDAVLALGPHFSRYAGALVDLMGSGPGTVACWSCTGPGQTAREEETVRDMLAPHSDRMLALCREVARDTTAPESLLARALGLLRDMALTQGDLGARRTGWRTCWPGGRRQGSLES